MTNLKPGWVMPNSPKEKCTCGKPLNLPSGYSDMGEVSFFWDCEDLCGTKSEEYPIAWMFDDEGPVTTEEIVALGFYVH